MRVAIPLYHFDLYRLEFAEQLEDLDYWGTLEADGVSVVEWGDRFAEAIPDECVVVRIHITGDDERDLADRPDAARAARGWPRRGLAACGSLSGVATQAGGEDS